MPLSATDKTKLKVLGALLIVAALVGYMRFGRQKSTDSAPDSALDTAPTVGTVMFSPADARKLLGGAIDTSVEDPPPPVRDIFSPPRTMPLMPPETNLAVPVSAELPPPAAAVPKGGGDDLVQRPHSGAWQAASLHQ